MDDICQDKSDLFFTGSNQCWNCESVGFYKELPVGPADFSQDGSLLAVGFGASLTLWDPDTNALRTSLAHHSASAHLRCDCRVSDPHSSSPATSSLSLTSLICHSELVLFSRVTIRRSLTAKCRTQLLLNS